MYDELWDAARAAAALEGDEFIEFEIRNATMLAATETAAYDMLVDRVPSQVARTIADKLPYLRRRRPCTPKHCGCDPMWLVWDHDDAICSVCAVARPYIVATMEKLPYGEWRTLPKKYERKNRFRIIINRFIQGTSARLSDERVATIVAHMRVMPEYATATDVRRALRKARLPEHYPDVPGIVAQLRQTAGLRIEPRDVDALRSMFVAVQAYMPKTGRVYMPSYNMILRCLLEHIGYADVDVYVPLLSHKRTYARVSRIVEEVMAMVRVA